MTDDRQAGSVSDRIGHEGTTTPNNKASVKKLKENQTRIHTDLHGSLYIVHRIESVGSSPPYKL